MSRTSKLWNYGIAVCAWLFCFTNVCLGHVYPQWVIGIAYGCLVIHAACDWLTTWQSKS